MQYPLLGIHHVTAVTAHANDNVRFYNKILGMRLVKKTVNQDDASAYHLFYADAKGSPGSDLTFFDWAHSPVQRHGNNSISEVSLRVGSALSMKFWTARLTENKIPHNSNVEYDSRSSLVFQDPEGQRLRLIDDGGVGTSYPWDASSVPAEHQIRGLGPVSL
ncbi:MAG: VOC family protein, partial [Verrucomicrobia bacterium]|nr:VOC family protein [Verrucomicrobiota bacterium]